MKNFLVISSNNWADIWITFILPKFFITFDKEYLQYHALDLFPAEVFPI